MCFWINIYAKAIELDGDLFHFRMRNIPFEEDGMEPEEAVKKLRRRSKRHIEDKIGMLRQDDRVDYVIEQHYLKREKRRFVLNDKDLDEFVEELYSSKPKNDYFNSDEVYELLNEKILKNLLQKRRPSLESESNEVNQEESVKSLALPSDINFNDHLFNKQWYLINEGQLKTPSSHDMNVKWAGLHGYTGRNISIVIVDDGLDHEHPDFYGKYV